MNPTAHPSTPRGSRTNSALRAENNAQLRFSGSFPKYAMRWLMRRQLYGG